MIARHSCAAPTGPAAVRVVFDRRAQLQCPADCTRDAKVTAADVTCVDPLLLGETAQ